MDNEISSGPLHPLAMRPCSNSPDCSCDACVNNSYAGSPNNLTPIPNYIEQASQTRTVGKTGNFSVRGGGIV